MTQLVLRTLELHDEAAFYSATQTKVAEKQEFAFFWKPGLDYRDYLNLLQKMEKGIDLPDSWVPGTLLFGFVGNRIVGRLSLRHGLNEYLSKVGGHIGYLVFQEYRCRGYATEMLRQSLHFAKKLGIGRVLITCDDDNIASQKTIEKCGGIFESLVQESELEIPKRRYWIELSH